MSVEAFLILLTAFSVITSLVTEAAKKVYKAASNIVALVCSIVVSMAGSVVYFIYTDLPVTPKTVCFAFLLIIANWLCSMVGYDKVMQTLSQMGVR